MAIREELVASAVNFLQDPNVASSPVENRVSFLQSKNLTQEEIDVALARAGTPSPVGPPPLSQAVVPAAQQQQQYYGRYQTQPYGWQPPPPVAPKRDWRDWFIMATVMAGVGSGLYVITKRYIKPLVAPPTPEKLEQDKTAVDEQFEKAFMTLEQLSKDTEALKASEQERTEKLDKILTDLESFMRDTKSASRRQEDETDRLRDEMKSLKDVIPKSMTSHKEFTDSRLREISNEVKSLKSLIGQRMSSAQAAAPPSSAAGYLRPSSGNAGPASPAVTPNTPAQDTSVKENVDVTEAKSAETPSQASRQDYLSSLNGRSSPFGNGSAAGKASIPAWQLAAANKANAASGSQQDAGTSS
ncbi:peroxisomal membrane anchor protein [Pseudomassariella vexata]|uniref:Peroxisomal membrane protein PEX14 n=1 Tax=Pseudomassariella vexata TaxID=1141098 RepID=A0A1Y2DTB5_9PEZI|nr:peroxisomal membrane anchor protein [Pseudomassariella vexata]ORY62521.1 peroxisomal membrane anchor protein [Pseudomassariella vexata]